MADQKDKVLPVIYEKYQNDPEIDSTTLKIAKRTNRRVAKEMAEPLNFPREGDKTRAKIEAEEKRRAWDQFVEDHRGKADAYANQNPDIQEAIVRVEEKAANIPNPELTNFSGESVLGSTGNKGVKAIVGKVSKAIIKLVDKAAKVIGKAVDVAVTAILSETGPIGKAVGWLVGKITEYSIKIAARLARDFKDFAIGAGILGAYAGAAFIGFLWLMASAFWAAVFAPIVITFVSLLFLLAFTVYILTVGAWVVPPWEGEAINPNINDGTIIDSAYIEVTKTPNSTAYENSEIPITTVYTITIEAERGSLSEIIIDYSCYATTEEGVIDCPPDPILPDPPDIISATQPYVFEYSMTYGPTYTDSRISDIITVTATAEGVEDEMSVGSASISIGSPPAPAECPSAGSDITNQIATSIPSGNVRLLPESRYLDENYCIIPTMIVLHWSGDTSRQSGWDGGNSATWGVLVNRGLTCNLGTDTNDAQLWLPFYTNQVMMSQCTGVWNPYSINIEMSGAFFTNNPPPPAQSEFDITVTTVCELMSRYGISVSQIRGHYEAPANGGKTDPGAEFLYNVFRPTVQSRCG